MYINLQVFCFAFILLWLLRTALQICIRSSLHRFKIISSTVYWIHIVAWIFQCFLFNCGVCVCMVMAKENNYKIKNTTPKGEKVLFYVMCMWRSHLSSHILHKETSLSKNELCIWQRSMGFFEGFQTSLVYCCDKTLKTCIISLKDLKVGTWRQKLKQRPWRNAAYWLVSTGLSSLLSYTTQGHPPRG